MPVLSIEEKKRRVREITAEDSSLQRIISMTKPNDAPSYDTEILEKSKATVRARGKKFAAVARDFAAGKKFAR